MALSTYIERKESFLIIVCLFQTRIIYRPGIQEVHITQGPIVMTCPAAMTTAMTSATHMHGDVIANGNVTTSTTPTVTATVMMSPPDYHVAASRIPRYSSVSTPPGTSISFVRKIIISHSRLWEICRRLIFRVSLTPHASNFHYDNAFTYRVY